MSISWQEITLCQEGHFLSHLVSYGSFPIPQTKVSKQWSQTGYILINCQYYQLLLNIRCDKSSVLKNTAATVLLAHHHNRTVAVCCFQGRNTVIVTRKLPQSWRARQHAVPSGEHCHPSVLWCCWLGGWQEGHLACKGSATTIPKSLLLATGLSQSNITWEKFWKNEPVKLSIVQQLQTDL